MNGKYASPSRPKQALLAIDFLVVGGGIAGLACALALRRVGHRVTVLEKDRNIDGDGIPSGVRLPPNGSKILFQWGLRGELHRIGTKSDGLLMLVYESGDRLGRHIWSEEVLRETRGEWIYTRHDDLRRLLYRAAISAGATVRFNSTVTSVDAGRGTVTLASGEVLRAHIVVGADGPNGASRREFPGADADKNDPGTLRMYHTTVSRKSMMQDRELLDFLEPKQGIHYLLVWFGNEHCLLAFPVQQSNTLAIHVYVPKDGTHGTWADVGSKEKMLASLGDVEPRLKRLLKLGTPPKTIPMRGYSELEDWVHDGGRLVLIGDAAHPILPGSIQGTALSLEDAGVLAKLFSHLLSEDQISSFLYAFQDLRIPRCTSVATSELGNLTFMTVPPGDFQAGRDAMLRAKDAAGLNVLTPEEGDLNSERWEELKCLFGYDAEDEADNWWVQWGLLAMRAKGADLRADIGVQFLVDERRTGMHSRPVVPGRYLQAA